MISTMLSMLIPVNRPRVPPITQLEKKYHQNAQTRIPDISRKKIGDLKIQSTHHKFGLLYES